MWICINSLKTKEEAEKIMKQQHTKTSRADSCTSHALCVWLILFALPSLFLTRACLVSLLVSLSSIRKLILLGGIFKKWFSFATIKTHTMQPNLSLIHAHASALNTDIIARRTYDFSLYTLNDLRLDHNVMMLMMMLIVQTFIKIIIVCHIHSTPRRYSTPFVCSLLTFNGIFFAL